MSLSTAICGCSSQDLGLIVCDRQIVGVPQVPSSVSLSERSGSSSSVPTSTSKPKPAKNRSLAELRYPFFDTGRMLEHLMVGASCGEVCAKKKRNASASLLFTKATPSPACHCWQERDFQVFPS